MNKEVICANCEQVFYKDIRRINESQKNGWKLYCCKECAHQGRLTKIKVSCAYCGKELEVQPHIIKNSKSGNVFCSKSCACSFNNTLYRSGENNPNWIDGQYYGNSVYTKLAYRTYKHECAICGCSDEDMLQVHHIDQDHSNNDVDNLIILCANDHLKLHRNGQEITQEIKDSRQLLN